MIKPKILKGFRDALPKQEILRKRLISIIENTFRSSGFVPIDTPALEYTEVLLGKGGGETDKQVFRFEDNGGRDVSMRFDLTVPLARYVSTNRNEINLPFKRYHIAKVWRGENPQKGRYREFTQCDFDIIGADNTESDFEILLMMYSCMKNMGIDKFKVHVSHRGLLNTYFKKLGVSDNSTEILRAIDKLGKIGQESVSEILKEEGLTEEHINSIISFISINGSSMEDVLGQLIEIFGTENEDIKRLKDLTELIAALDMEANFIIDPSITRGLDYYTGIVYETFLDDLPNLGSVCSGGRYNNLTRLYSKEEMPGVGSCIGIDRLIAGLEELEPDRMAVHSADVLVGNFGDSLVEREKAADYFRKNGIYADLYFGNKKPNNQYNYIEKAGIPYILTKTDNKICSIKRTSDRKVFLDISYDEAIKIIKTEKESN